jgi:putative peptidoglycan lipid II flippase
MPADASNSAAESAGSAASSAPPATAATMSERDATGFLAGAVRVMSGLTLLSRFAGLARDVLTARLFGDGLLGSSFRAAYALPNFFRRLFGEGALSAAFLPEYALLKRDDPQRAKQLASLVVSLTTLATSAITALIVAALLVRLALWPLDTSQGTGLSISLIILMLPMMPAVCLAAILGGMLQAHGRFAIPAASPIVLNALQIIAGGVFWLGLAKGDTVAAYAVGSAALLASWLTVAWALSSLRGKVAWRTGASEAKENARRVFKRFVPAVLGLGTLQLNTMLDTLVAMWPIWIGATMFSRPVPLDNASNSILSYTQTLYQFPLGVFGIAVATAVFPLLSRSSDRPEEFTQHLRRGLRLSFFIGLPASVGLVLIRHDLVATIFGGGQRAFSDEGLARAATVLLGFAPAVWAYSVNHVLTRAYYAKGDTTTPMRVACGCVLLNVVLNFTLIWPLREAGLAFATATSAFVQCIALTLLMPRKLGVTPFSREVWTSWLRIALAACGMAASVLAALWVWSRLLGEPARWLHHAVVLALGVIVGGGTFALGTWLARLPELRWLLQRAPRGAGKDGAEGMTFD